MPCLHPPLPNIKKFNHHVDTLARLLKTYHMNHVVLLLITNAVQLGFSNVMLSAQIADVGYFLICQNLSS